MLINRDFALLRIGQLVSGAGDWLFVTSVAIWIAADIGRGQTWAPAAVGGASLAVAVPTVVLGPLAGVYVDRWDKRRTMLAADLVRFGLMAALVALPVAGSELPKPAQLAVVYVTIAAATVCASFFAPAQLAMIGDVVPSDQQTRAASYSQLALYAGLILGPALAGPLVVLAGPAWFLALNALSFLVSFAAVRAIPARPASGPPAEGRGSVWRELGDGVLVVARVRALRTLAVASVVVVGGSGAVNALNVFFVRDVLHVSVAAYGLLTAVLPIGALLGAAASAVVAPRVGAGRLFSLSVLLLGLLVLIYSRQTSFVLAAAVLLLAGVPEAGINVAIAPIIVAATPAGAIGRVEAALGSLVSLAQTASVALAGYLGSTLLAGLDARFLTFHVGAIDAMFTVSGVLICAGGVYALLSLRGFSIEPAPGGDDGGVESVVAGGQ